MSSYSLSSGIYLQFGYKHYKQIKWQKYTEKQIKLKLFDVKCENRKYTHE